MQALHLRLWEHHKRKSRMIMRARRPGHLLQDSVFKIKVQEVQQVERFRSEYGRRVGIESNTSYSQIPKD